jgi:hypothetical protein
MYHWALFNLEACGAGNVPCKMGPAVVGKLDFYSESAPMVAMATHGSEPLPPPGAPPVQDLMWLQLWTQDKS